MSLLRADAARLPLADASVACVVTSPPYNVGKDYGEQSDDALTWQEYQGFAKTTAAEMARVLVEGGRLWLNVSPAMPFGADERRNPARVWDSALTEAGLSYRDWIVWEQIGPDAATAWGSYGSPNAPNIRGRYELILLFFKDRWARGRVEKNDLTTEEWPHLTRNVWKFSCATPARAWHPAPFPAELPLRCIRLSTWPGEVVLDPFVGSGTTVRAAYELGRVGVGCDLSSRYLSKARDRGRQGSLLVAGQGS